VCSAGHSYDIARTGYVNLLQPQDRRSRAAGDAKAAVAARAALLASGVGRALIDRVTAHAALALPPDAVAIDLGSGSGDGLAAVAERCAITGIGIDLSTAAADHAARRFPSLTWVVANADRRLPLADRSVDLMLSLYGRRNPGEADRVLTPAGVVLIAVPAPDDLIELRALVQGEPVERDRANATVAEHQPQFVLVDRESVRETLDLDRESLVLLLRSSYRGARRAVAERVAALSRMRVTLASEVLLLRPRQRPRGSGPTPQGRPGQKS
jgi:23S rRNA (guanine745-N1)-methyltransferase